MISVFLMVAMLILAVMYAYVAVRLIQALHFSRAAQLSMSLYLLVCWLATPFPFVLRLNDLETSLGDAVSWFVYANMGVFSLIFIAYLAADMMRAFAKKLCIVKSEVCDNAYDEDRRKLMKNAFHFSILGATGGLAGLGMQQALQAAVVKVVQVPIGNLPADFAQLRIVQFTDLHVGPTIKKEFVAQIVQQINALKPHIIVMTGDLVDGSVAHLRPDVAPLAELKATYGKFFITGNHEYYSGVDAWLDETQRLGFTNLINHHTLITHGNGKLLLAGVTDYRAHQYKAEHASDPQKALRNAPVADVKILLAHQPKSIQAATDAGFDLQISGHTHGGQYYPWNMVARLANPYIEGLHHHQDKTWIYVSRGTGYWGPPLRLGTEPEITLITLT